MKLGVFGSRTLRGDRVAAIILDELEKTKADTIVTTQEPRGVCTVAQNIAKEEHKVLELHFLNNRYLGGMFSKRSEAVIKSADKILLIHDGVSKGTSNELEAVKKAKKPYRYEVLEIDELEHIRDERLSSFKSEKDDDVDFSNFSL